MSDVQSLLKGDRRRLLASGAVALLAQEGARGLTHRRLDRELDLPQGSTSNAFATRDALFAAALASLAEPQLQALRQASEQLPDHMPPGEAAELLVETIFAWLDPAERGGLIARYEFILEATRRPALQEQMAELRAAFTQIAHQLARSTGHPDPKQVAPLLVALTDGVLIAHITGQQQPPSRPQVLDAVRRLLGTN